MRACWESISQRRFGSGGEGIIEIGSNDVVLPQLLFCFVPTGSEIRSMPQVRYFMCFYATGTSFRYRTRCGCFVVAVLSLFRGRCSFSLQLSLLLVLVKQHGRHLLKDKTIIFFASSIFRLKYVQHNLSGCSWVVNLFRKLPRCSRVVNPFRRCKMAVQKVLIDIRQRCTFP